MEDMEKAFEEKVRENEKVEKSDKNDKMINNVIDAIVKIRAYYCEKNGLEKFEPPKDFTSGQIECPSCKDGILHFRIFSGNGHIHGKCNKCKLGWIQ